MKLNYKKLGSGQPVIILHGLFGMLDNWQSIGRELSKDYEVWLVDQRNHGHSPHADTHTYPEMAEDLRKFIDDHGIVKPVVVGHSMGGKTALYAAQLFPDKLAGVVSVDMGAKEYPIHHDSIIDALKVVPVETIESRAEAEEHMKTEIAEFGVRQFLLKNLNRKSDGTYTWRFNLPVLEASLPEIVAALPDVSVDVPVLFLYGTKSNYVRPTDKDDLQKLFPNSTFESVDAGHWLHAEQPEITISAISKFISGQNQ